MKNMQLQAMALKENRDSYVIFDQALVDSFCQISDSVSETLQRGLEVNEGNSVYAADSFEGLAEAFGLDADEFTATVERYNELCHAGDDVDFGKDAAYLKPIEKALLHWQAERGLHRDHRFGVHQQAPRGARRDDERHSRPLCHRR